jgi:hypothetical protein
MFDIDVNREFYHVENTERGNDNINANRHCMWIVAETLRDISVSRTVLIRITVFCNMTPCVLVDTYNGDTVGCKWRVVH